MYNIQGGFIYIDCTKLSKNNPITVPGVYNALSRCNKIPVMVNLDMSGTTAAGDDYKASGVGVCNLGVVPGDNIRLETTIYLLIGSTVTGFNYNFKITPDDIISM